MDGPSSNRFSSLLLEGLDHYRRGRMLDAVRSWEEAYLLEPTNLRAREFLRSALERIHARMTATTSSAQPGVSFSDMQQLVPQVPLEQLSGPGMAFRSFERHPWLRPPNETAPGIVRAPPPDEVEVLGEIDDAPAVYVPPQERAAPEPARAQPPAPPPESAQEERDPNDLARERAAAAEPPRAPPADAKRASSSGRRDATAPREPARAPPPRASPPPPPREPEPRSPWDEGPSVALPQSDPPPVPPNAEVWKIHGPPSQPIPHTPDETAVWMTAADELMALDDFSGALELVNKVLALHPEHARALAIRATCEQNLLQMYESHLGGTARRPRVLLGPDEVIWLNLDPRAGFVLAQIDGQVSFEDLYAICGLTHLDTARILSQLLDEAVIEAVGELNHLF